MRLLFISVVRALELGVYGPITSYSQQHLAAVVAFDLDFRKHFEGDLKQRFGDPVVDIPFLHEDLRNVSVRVGTSHGEPEAIDIDGNPIRILGKRMETCPKSCET